MKAKKKPAGIKQRIREERKREERIGLAVIVAILAGIILVSGFLVNSMLNQPSPSQIVNSATKPKAAIVDQLSLTYPNQTFIETATGILEQAGYRVDYYPGENVTVEFYRNLPTHDYRLIILRVHSALGYNRTPPLALFTAESYSTTKYLYEQLTNQLDAAIYNYQNQDFTGTAYFGIRSEFIQHGLNGRFRDTVIILMGCNGLTYTDMAKAFIERGARFYIGWSDAVSASHTDRATTRLLQHFFIEKRTLNKSVEKTFREIGYDPMYKSQLIYYPVKAGPYTIQSVASNIVASTMNTQCIEPSQRDAWKNQDGFLQAAKFLAEPVH